MKKILALVLTLCLLCGGVAVAENTTINQDSTSKTANTTLSYTIATNETYTVTIPSKVELNNKDGALSGTVSVRLQTPNFNVSGKTITVKLTSSANDLKLKLANSKSEIPYTLKAAGKEYKADDILLNWTYGEKTDQTLTLVAQATVSSNLPAGEYTDTLTFTVSVDSSEASVDGVTVNPWENGGIIGGEALETE